MVDKLQPDAEIAAHTPFDLPSSRAFLRVICLGHREKSPGV